MDKCNNHSLIELLQQNALSDMVPMHMPGHKRNMNGLNSNIPWQLDITEISGFDDLHNPAGCILNIQKKIQFLFNSPQSRVLVGGSTCGILSAVGCFAYSKNADCILIAENCHKSVYHAAELFHLTPILIQPTTSKEYPFFGSITSNAIEKHLEQNMNAAAVVITSPTYEGIISDIADIAQICHRFGIPLIVDEAHGAHLGVSEKFPQNAICLGADITIDSLHKTLPALTQTSVLHFNPQSIDSFVLDHMLDVFETSSPSYILMASVECCADYLLEKGKEAFDRYYSLLEKFYLRCKRFKNIFLFSPQDNQENGYVYKHDKGKIVIVCNKSLLSGIQLADRLRNDYSIEPEMSAVDYVLCMTSIQDTAESFDRLYSALKEIDDEINDEEPDCDLTTINSEENFTYIRKQVLSCAEALKQQTQEVEMMDSIGKIAAEYVWAYPPGIPLLIPGERISEQAAHKIQYLEQKGVCLKKMRKTKKGYIAIVDEDE